MRVNHLEEMVKGWFCGDFNPAILRTSHFEVAIKRYRKGDKEGSHVHKLAREVTVVVEGCVRMGEKRLKKGDMLLLEPGEPSDFEALEDTTLCVVKTPSVLGDKYELGGSRA